VEFQVDLEVDLLEVEVLEVEFQVELELQFSNGFLGK